MPKISEDHFLLGFGIVFAIWVFGVLPFLYGPIPRFAEIRSPPEPHSEQAAQNSQGEPRGTMDAPLVVKVLPSPKTAQEAAEEAQDREEKTSTDRRLMIFTGLLVIVGIGQGIVFAWQRWQLKKTVAIASDQSIDMKHSIAEATRAAGAMEEVAKHVAISAKAAQESVATVRDATSRQMRAYLAVLIGAGIYQGREKQFRFEGKPVIVNSGFTPAHKVRYRAHARIMATPVPPDFEFEIENPLDAGTTIGAQQNSMMSALVQDYVPDEQVEDIKSGKKQALHVWGCVWYEDVFGESHLTEFCQCLTWLPNGTIYGFYLPHRNKAT
jgi:hypothetical protein